jgi:homoserine O-acetyltransferase
MPTTFSPSCGPGRQATLAITHFGAALRAIKARTIILAAELDRYFPPVDAEYEAKHIPNGECRVVKSVWGHMAPMNPADTPAIDGALTELLGD